MLRRMGYVYVNFRIAYAKGAAFTPLTLMLYFYKGSQGIIIGHAYYIMRPFINLESQ